MNGLLDNKKIGPNEVLRNHGGVIFVTDSRSVLNWSVLWILTKRLQLWKLESITVSKPSQTFWVYFLFEVQGKTFTF